MRQSPVGKLLGAALALLVLLDVGGARAFALEINEPIPSVTVQDLAGATRSLSALEGKVTYIDFWASWCPPCRESFPFMNELAEKYGEKGLNILAISVDQDRSMAEKALKRFSPQFQVLFDPSGEAAKAFKLPTMPTSFVVDAKGAVRVIHRGFRGSDKEDLEKAISSLLAQ